MSGLSDYLSALNRERGWSTRDIEREAHRHGHQLSYASASRYLSGRHPASPSAETLQAWADIFGVPLNEVREAAGRPGLGEPFDLGPEASRLTGPQREAIRTTVRLFVEQNDALERAAERDGATTPGQQAYGLAAKEGRSARQLMDEQQDRAAEEGGA